MRPGTRLTRASSSASHLYGRLHFLSKGPPVVADKTQSDIFERAISPAPAPVPRSLLVFAHPDDETIALGARLANFGDAHMVHGGCA